jgi:hypothetical protein
MFTKGEWTVRPTNVGMVIQTDGYGDIGILTIRAEDQENADLCASAPDMYEALKEALQALEYIVDEFKVPNHTIQTITKCEQAIAKSEGR